MASSVNNNAFQASSVRGFDENDEQEDDDDENDNNDNASSQIESVDHFSTSNKVDDADEHGDDDHISVNSLSATSESNHNVPSTSSSASEDESLPEKAPLRNLNLPMRPVLVADFLSQRVADGVEEENEQVERFSTCASVNSSNHGDENPPPPSFENVGENNSENDKMKNLNQPERPIKVAEFFEKQRRESTIDEDEEEEENNVDADDDEQNA